MTTSALSRLDHITVAAATLRDGVDWVAARLKGITPPTGGAHPVMGNHNHLLRLGDCLFLEVIAPDPAVPVAPRSPRWFALDDPTFLDSLRRDGPRLATWVVRTHDIAAVAARCPVPLGPPERVGRGSLEWRITVPPDGALPAGGVVPTLIQWPDDRPHPAESMADFGVRLDSLTLHHPSPALVAEALARLDVAEARPGGPVTVDPTPAAAPRLVARLRLYGGETVVLG